jgi:hypothetical protein
MPDRVVGAEPEYFEASVFVHTHCGIALDRPTETGPRRPLRGAGGRLDYVDNGIIHTPREDLDTAIRILRGGWFPGDLSTEVRQPRGCASGA